MGQEWGIYETCAREGRKRRSSAALRPTELTVVYPATPPIWSILFNYLINCIWSPPQSTDVRQNEPDKGAPVSGVVRARVSLYYVRPVPTDISHLPLQRDCQHLHFSAQRLPVAFWRVLRCWHGKLELSEYLKTKPWEYPQLIKLTGVCLSFPEWPHSYRMTKSQALHWSLVSLCELISIYP